MTSVAMNGGEGPVSSAYLASSVNTNPVVVRRIIQGLVKNGLLKGKTGKGGGSELALPPDKINLYQVYKAVHEEESVFEFNRNAPNKKCPLSCRMKEILEPVFHAADKGIEEKLKRIRLADLIHDLK
jgi:Rrf2 family protein